MTTTQCAPTDPFKLTDLNGTKTSGHLVYCGVPIDTGKRQIRTLRLRPGAWDEELYCDVQVVSLDNKPSYEAFSYVWGDPRDCIPIKVCGMDFEVTRSLGSALRRLRHPNEDRTLWVDAVCIDQSALTERNEQVALMGDIYANTDRLLIWLGEHDDIDLQRRGGKHSPWQCNFDSNQVHAFEDPMFAGFHIINDIAKGKHLDELSCFERTEAAKLRVVDSFPGGLKGLHAIMTLPWWSRIWTVQETILPKTAEVVFGSFRCPWETFRLAAYALLHHTNSCCSSLLHTLPTSDDRTLDLLYRRVIEIEVVREDLDREGQTNFYELLSMFSSRQATLPQDKVYGLLGLIDYGHRKSDIAPDYALSKSQVYQAVTLRLLGDENSLKLWERTNGRSPDLPTWTLDWEKSTDAFTRNLDIQRSYMNGTYRRNHVEEVIAEPMPNSRVQMRGARVATIGAASNISLEDEYTQWTQLMRGFEELLRYLNLRSDSAAYISGGCWKDAIWRTIVGDLIMEESGASGRKYRSVTAEDEAAFREWQEIFSSTEYPGVNASRMTRTVREIHSSATVTMIGRTLFVCNEGYLGVGPPDLRPGDVIYVLSGGRVPFILHTVETTNGEASHRISSISQESKPSFFELVGSCYLHGIMHKGADTIGLELEDVILQ